MILFEEKIPANIRPAFISKVIRLSAEQQYDPDWIMAVMNSESGFNASIKNGIGCVGLIQFCPDTPGGSTKTINGKPVSLEYLRGLDPVTQLDYAFDYYRPLKNKITRFHDMYLATFYPAAMGKPDDHVIGSEKGMAWAKQVAKSNPGIDLNKDGTLTVGEFKQFALKKVPVQYHDKLENEGLGVTVDAEKYVKANWKPLLIISGVMLTVGVLLYASTSSK